MCRGVCVCAVLMVSVFVMDSVQQALSRSVRRSVNQLFSERLLKFDLNVIICLSTRTGTLEARGVDFGDLGHS